MTKSPSIRVAIEVREDPGKGSLVGDRSRGAIIEAAARFVRHIRHDIECHFTIDAKIGISASVNGDSVSAEGELLEQTVKLYTVIHDDKDGNSSFYLLRSDHDPARSEAVAALLINFDADLEHLYIEEATEDRIIEL
jgi:hypothetical protein